MCIFNCDVRISTYGEGDKSESERKSQRESTPGARRGGECVCVRESESKCESRQLALCNAKF
jgi:hypothetical protein